MKTCLGMSILNEAPFLRLHLPYMLSSKMFDGVVVVDGGSTDGTQAILSDFASQYPDIRFHLFDRVWDWDFSAQQNTVIEHAEQLKYSHFFKYDPDELMFHADIHAAFHLLSHEPSAVAVSRLNFEGDRVHYCPYLYPDTQVRFWKLHRGIRWERTLHAGTNVFRLFGPEDTTSNPGVFRSIVNMRGTNIYHYEGVRPMQERALKWHNYQLVKVSKPPVAGLPRHEWPEKNKPVRFSVPYTAPQPLDPDVIGKFAPYTSPWESYD